MSPQKAQRFWQKANVCKAQDGYGVRLDERPLRTPGKAALAVPTRALAEEIAAEWDAQEDRISPDTMPMTRLANSAIDKVAKQKPDVANMLAAYADADLLCYRAESPERLRARQAEHWDPYLAWAQTELGAQLELRSGVIYRPQDQAAIKRLAELVGALDHFELTAFHDLVTTTGSLVLAFAAIRNHRPPDDIWHASRIDEDWQIQQWGEDEGEKLLSENKRATFFNAARFFSLI